MNLDSQHCKSCEENVIALSSAKIKEFLGKISDWKIENNHIVRRFEFKGFYKTMAFVNAVAWIAYQENHHPEMEVGFNYCVVKYTSHSARGLTENDFICAAKVEKLL